MRHWSLAGAILNISDFLVEREPVWKLDKQEESAHYPQQQKSELDYVLLMIFKIFSWLDCRLLNRLH